MSMPTLQMVLLARLYKFSSFTIKHHLLNSKFNLELENFNKPIVKKK